MALSMNLAFSLSVPVHINTVLPSASLSDQETSIAIIMPRSGTNSQGNHYNTPGGTNSSGGSSYHYSNSNGSYYYANDNGSTYYNNGNGSSTYTTPSGNSHTSSSSNSK
jgi:hypothetical protein